MIIDLGYHTQMLNKKYWIALTVIIICLFFGWRDLNSGIDSGEPLTEYGMTLEIGEGTKAMVAALNDIEEYRKGSRLKRLYAEAKQQFLVSIGIYTNGIARRKFKIANRLLDQGETESALELYEEVWGYYSGSAATDKSSKFRAALNSKTAIAYMRLGEQLNCQNNPQASVCIIPLDNAAVHKLTEGSTKAIKIYQEEILADNPDDYEAKWLLNLAYMTLGKYPDGVPAEHLLPMPGMIQDYDGPRFANVADMMGVADNTRAGGAIVEDFNGDDMLDIFVTDWDLTGRVKLYLRQADGSFHDATQAAGLADMPGGLNVTHGDYNNDDFPDIFILRGAWARQKGAIPNSLLKNNGDGTFTDVTKAADVLDFSPTPSAKFADLNHDGWLDLIVAAESDKEKGEDFPARIYLNDQDGTFTDTGAKAGFSYDCRSRSLAVGDYDNDGNDDIYVSCLDKTNHLFRNQWSRESKTVSFEDVAMAAGVQNPTISFAAWFWDYDNDGREDLLVSGYDRQAPTTPEIGRSYAGLTTALAIPAFYRNMGDGRFSDQTKALGVDQPIFAMGANFGDFDNDGWLDAYFGTGTPDYRAIYPNVALSNTGGSGFRDITGASGLGHIQKGHGTGFADIDHDGDQDIFIELGGESEGDIFQNALFENLTNQNNWIKLLLVGTKSNRSAIGARIKVDVRYPGGTRRSIYRTVNSGGSFGSSPLRSEIGLGKAATIERVTINWPSSGIKQIFDDLSTDQAYRINENSDKHELIRLAPLPLRLNGRKASAHQH